MKQIIFRILVGLIVVLTVLAFKAYYQSGAFNTVTNQFSGTTQPLEGLPGVEDITIDQATGTAFLSSMDRWQQRNRPGTRGAIYTLNMNDSLATPVVKTDAIVFEFKPHGISLYRSAKGKVTLFVINHRVDANYVEVFDYRNDSLIHKESISDPLMISPNDIVGVGEGSFYFTNDHNEKASPMRMVKDLLAIGTGNVVFFENGKATLTSVESIQYANGINVSADGKELYLASTTGKEIFVYDRDIVSGALKRSRGFLVIQALITLKLTPMARCGLGAIRKCLSFCRTRKMRPNYRHPMS